MKRIQRGKCKALTKPKKNVTKASNTWKPKKGKTRAALAPVQKGRNNLTDVDYVPLGQALDQSAKPLRAQQWSVNALQLACLKERDMKSFRTSQKLARDWRGKPCPWCKKSTLKMEKSQWQWYYCTRKKCRR